ncbi:MAG TPA: hypothetical protein VL285_10330 [Bryobacteraceae bacterium]|nr:hypothetical protein [Bryobacteraceae bacterium]
MLAVIAFLLGSAVTASAQPNTPFQCFANGGVSTPARSEGLTELVGDLVLNCIGGVPTAPGGTIPPVNIQVFLNTSLTSRLLTTSTSGTQYSEALLLLDEPAPGAQFPCTASTTVCAGFGNGLGTSNAPSLVGYYGSGSIGSTVAGCAFTGGNCPGNNKNVFQAIQTASNSVTFLAVPIDPPGTSGSRVVRITNIRANANALGVAGANATPTPIVETISPTPPQFLPVSNPSQTVAFIQRGLTFAVFTSRTNTTALSATLQQCDNSRSGVGATNVLLGVLRYTENFATAFKKRFTGGSTALPSNGPTASLQQNSLTVGTYNTESGFVSNLGAMSTLPSGTQTGSPGTTAGFADWGTRVKAVFNNIPAGVSLFVDTDGVFTGTLGATTGSCNTTSTPSFTGCLDHFSLTSSETGAYTAVGRTATSPAGNTTSQLTVTNGTAVAVWEDLDSDPNSFASVNFGVWVQYTPSPGTNSPALGTATVNGSYAPTSTVTTASNANVPRFADTSTAANIFTVVPCLTTLLFPYLTNQAGFDTGIAISATATDPFGTTPQSGTCTLNWYGTAFTGATPTPVVNSGTSYVTLLSTTLNNVTGGFSGYMIAVCRFQYAHGFAFISDLGARNLAMGYLALVIPDPTSSSSGRMATPHPCGGASTIGGCAATGENLSN